MDRNIHPGLWKSVVQEQGIASCLKCAHKIYSNLWCQTGPNSLDPSVRGYSRWVLPVDVKLLQVWTFSELQYLIINTTLLTCTYTATKEMSQCEFTATYWLLYLVHIAINKSYCIQQKNQHTCTVHKLLKNLLKSSQSIGYLWMGTFDLYTCYNLQGIYCTCTYKITHRKILCCKFHDW